MKRIFTALVICLLEISVHAQFTSAPAFPGAEGFGRYVTGGRGGQVIHVTNLNDSGTGSFRAAVSGNSKKIVVFDVAGVIALSSDLTIGANTTILGQTSPSPGITLRYYTVRPGANNIIRFIRFRRGQERDVNDGGDAMWQREKTGIIIDHCSFSWSIDEVASFYDNNNFTLQWCTLGESLNNTGHTKDAHGYGGIWGGKLASFHHNLLLHVMNRAPRFNGARYNWTGYTGNQLYSTYKWENSLQAENVDFRNCVMYNWGSGNGCYGGPGGGQINIVNNYYKAGPATSNRTRVTQISYADSGNSGNNDTYEGMTSRYYINGNYVAAASNPVNYDWSGVKYDLKTYELNGAYYTPDVNNYYGSAVEHTTVNGVSCVKIKMDEPSPKGDVTTHSATTAFNKVLDHAGSSLFRDNVDARYATEAKNGTTTYTGSVSNVAGIIDLVSDANGYTEANFGTGSRDGAFDTDTDGIPDAWETANGLNPNSADDALTFTLDSRGYYTNLEVYANNIVESMVKEERADADDTFSEYYPAVTYVDVNGNGTGGDTGDDDDDDDQTAVTSGTETTPQSDSTTKDTDFAGLSYTVEGSCIAGKGNNNMALKIRTRQSTVISVNENYAITGISVEGVNNYTDADATIDGVYVDGSTENLLAQPVVFSTDKTTNSFSLSEFSAKQNITITYASGGSSQVNLTFTFDYVRQLDALTFLDKTADSGRSGIVTLVFNNPMTDSNSPKASLNGQQLAGVAEGTSVKFAYSGLDYGQTYTFSIPANTLQDEAGNKYAEEISFSITTASHSAVEKRLFNFVVGKNGDVDAAIAAANAYTGSGRYLIFVPDGTHQLNGNQTITLASNKDALTGTDGSTVQPGASFTNAMTWLKKSNVSVIGQSEDKTILTNTPLYPGISYTSTFEIRNGYSNTYIQDLTLRNNYANGAHNKGVAVAFYDRGTNTILKNVKCWSNQDTYTSQATRCYYENSTFAGTVDFICGSGDVWFEACDLVINDRTGNVITAPRTAPSEQWGYVFNGCTISLAQGATAAKDGNWNLGRPWNSSPAATYLYTRMNTTPSAAAWTNMTDGCVLRFHEYGSMASDGSLVSLTGRSISACNGAANSDSPVLTAEQAAAYTVANAVGNNGQWDPASLTEQERVVNLKATEGALTWDDNDYAICWVVFKDGVYFGNVATNSIAVTENATYTVRAANEMGGLGEAAVVVYNASSGFETTTVDYTSRFGVLSDDWYIAADTKAGVCDTQYAPQITTNDGRTANMVERYEENVNTTGEIIWQSHSDLVPGIYTIEIYGNAFFTNGRGFESDMADGATDVAYLFTETHNEQGYAVRDSMFIPGNIATSTTENSLRTLENIVVGSDGYLKVGIGKAKAGTNWHTVNIKGVTAIVSVADAFSESAATLDSLLQAADNCISAGSVSDNILGELESVVEAIRDSSPDTAEGYETAIASLSSAIEKFETVNSVIVSHSDIIAPLYALYKVEYNEIVNGAHQTFGESISAFESAVYSSASSAELVNSLIETLRSAACQYVADANPAAGEVFNLTFLLTNPDVTQFWSGDDNGGINGDSSNHDAWGVQPDGWYNEQNGGNFQVMTNSEMASGGEVFMEYWSATAASDGFVLCQKVTLPAGTYQMTGRVGAQQYDGNGSTTNITFSANDIDGTQITYGALQNGQLDFVQAQECEVSVGLKAHAGNNARWMAINKVQLYKVPVSNIIISDEEDFLPVSMAGNVTLNRKIEAGTINALVVPFALNSEHIASAFGEGTVVAEYTENVDADDNITLNFNEVSAIRANVPVLIRPSVSDTSFDFDGVTIVPVTNGLAVAGNYYQFVGSYSASNSMPVGSYYVSGGRLWKSTTELAIKSTRAYIAPVGNVAGAKKVVVRFNGDILPSEDATAITGVNAAEDNAEIYSLQGLRLSRLQKGLNVVNGRKVYVK